MKISEEERQFYRTMHSLTVLEEFFATVESHLSKVCEDHRQRLEHLLQTPNVDWVKRTSERLAHHYKFEIDWQQMETYTFVLLLNIVAETELKAFCEIQVVNHPDLMNSLDEVTSGDLDKIKCFLKKAKIKIDFATLWQPLTDIQCLRNWISHASGRIKIGVMPAGDDKRLKDLEGLIRRDKRVSISEFKEIEIEKSFLEKAIKDVRRIFHALYEAVGLSAETLRHLKV